MSTLTVNDVIDAMMRAAADFDMEPPTYHEPTFRTWPPVLAHDNGPILTTVCEERVGGRWEPFISVRRVPQRIWEQVATR